MDDRRAYHARGYTGQAAKVDCWHNALSYDEETHLRGLVLDHFDPEALARDNLDSRYCRELIKETMQKNGISWDHATTFNLGKGALDHYLP